MRLYSSRSLTINSSECFFRKRATMPLPENRSPAFSLSFPRRLFTCSSPIPRKCSRERLLPRYVTICSVRYLGSSSICDAGRDDGSFRVIYRSQPAYGTPAFPSSCAGYGNGRYALGIRKKPTPAERDGREIYGREIHFENFPE